MTLAGLAKGSNAATFKWTYHGLSFLLNWDTLCMCVSEFLCLCVAKVLSATFHRLQLLLFGVAANVLQNTALEFI